MKYKCPYCGEKSFTFISKMTAGGMASKGRKCPLCGKHAVHGLKSTIFRTVVLSAVFIFILVNYYKAFVGMEICLAVFVGAYLVCMIANGLFFELTENNRKDIR